MNVSLFFFFFLFHFNTILYKSLEPSVISLFFVSKEPDFLGLVFFKVVLAAFFTNFNTSHSTSC